MKKSVFTFLACVLASSVYATHFPPATAGAVKRLAHDENHIYILHYDGLEVLDKTTGTTVCYTQATGHIPEGNIKSKGPNGKEPELNALAVHDGTVWVGGNGFLTSIAGQEAQSWHFSYNITISAPERPYVPNLPMQFNCIAFDSSGRMYLGGNDQIGYLKQEGKATFEALPDNMYRSAEVWQMVVDKNDVAWVSYTSDSGSNSLVKYTAGGEVEEVSSKLDFGRDIKALALDKEGNLWFGTKNSPKIYRYDGETLEELEIEIAASGGNGRGICCMSFDDKGRLWLLQSNSQNLSYAHYSAGPLYCLSNGELTQYPLPSDAGLAYCLDVDGEDVYVGTDNGVLRLTDGRLVGLDTHWYAETPFGTAVKDVERQTRDEQEVAYDLQGRRLETGKTGNTGRQLYVKKGRIVIGR